MNEVDLIREVEKRPILYDKTVSGFNKTKLRDDAWKEVQEALQVTEMECKKRWRSLRDSFIKLQRTHGNRTRWPYVQAMSFLVPHVEPCPKKEQKSDESDQEDDRIKSNQVENGYSHENPKSSTDDDEDSSPSAKKQRLDSSEDENVDADELFLRSCANQLKRLTARQNAVARLKIQQVLYEAEFGPADDLPYVTPASDCDYEGN